MKLCQQCDSEIKHDGIKFCSRSCSAIFNNKLRPRKVKIKRVRINRPPKFKSIKCLNCETITHSNGKKYCSLKCSQEHKEKLLFIKIETGGLNLDPRQYKRYLIKKYGEKCMVCNWSEINPYSGKIPIELEHIDGNSENNNLNNLMLLCPNHHSLTPTYKALNIGRGRHKRKERYKAGKSF